MRFRCVEESPIASPNTGLTVSVYVPGEANTRADIFQAALRPGLRDYVAVGQLVPGVEDSGRSIDKMRRDHPLLIHRLDKLVFTIEQICDSCEWFPPQPERHGKPGGNPDRVADKKALVVKTA